MRSYLLAFATLLLGASVLSLALPKVASQAVDQQAAPTAHEMPPAVTPSPNTRRASFSVQVKDLVVPYGVMGLFVMPEEEVEIETLFERAGAIYTMRADAGLVRIQEDGEWTWTAPEEPGHYMVTIEGPLDQMVLNAFVMTPFRNGEPILNRYRIGQYQSRPLRGQARFLAPTGLIEVSDETAPIRVSPNFTLGDFASHQSGSPRYMALDELLIIKLEMLLEALQEEGVEVSTFTVMSGFRTPWYNASIGNTTRYSLHLYGRAADIFVDEDGDGRMDDLDGNGRVDRRDAKFLADFINGLRDRAWYQPFLGGLGVYGPKPHRGPFVHVDVRGYTARW